MVWSVPILIYCPFIGGLLVWNEYYIGGIYSITCSLLVLISGVFVKMLYYRETLAVREEDDDEAEDEINIPSCISYKTLHLLSTHKHFMNIIMHCVISGLICYSSFIILNPFFMKSILPLPVIPFIFITGAISLCIAHYSLISTPFMEIISYRPHHQDLFQLRFLRRPIYIIILGTAFIILRHTLINPDLYLIIIYCVMSSLPILWIFGILPPIDALVFWIMEQSILHIMGGSSMASESRLLINFTVSLVITTSIVFITNRTLVVYLATVVGLILSQNYIHWIYIITSILCSRVLCISKIQYRSSLLDYWYTSFFPLHFRPVVNSKHIILTSFISLFHCSVMLCFSLVIIHLTVTYGSEDGDKENRLLMIFSLFIIIVFLFVNILPVVSGIFYGGWLRNPFHVRNMNSLSNLKRKKSRLLCLSIPRQILLKYVSPLLMVTYISLSLETNVICLSNVWFNIATLRILRKVWQNSSVALTELLVLVIISLSESSWADIGLGTQAMIVGIIIHVTWNIYERLKFYCLLLLSFLVDRKQRTRYFKLSLFLTIILLPVSLISILLSAILSTSVMPLFTLPIFVFSFPRPKTFWPRFIDPCTISNSPEAVYYQQAIPTISKALSQAFTSGIVSHIQPGLTVLIRFQDRLSLVSVTEKGYGFCLIHVQGLELQETSCHTIEATRIDDIYEALYNDNRRSLSYWCNTYPLHNIFPMDVFIGQVYSDARNTLTGIIDQTENLQKFSLNLYKTLIWTITQYMIVCIERSTVADNRELKVAWSDVNIEQDTNDERQNSVSSLDIAIDLCSGIASSQSCNVNNRGLPIQSLTDLSSVLTPSHIKINNNNKICPLPDINHLPSSTPFSSVTLSPVLSRFPHGWFDHVLGVFTTQRLNQTLAKQLKELITACYALVDIPTCKIIYKTATVSTTRPVHVYKGFNDEYTIPVRAKESMAWMKGNTTLHELVIKAYRYAVKLLYDEAILGEAVDNRELSDYLQEYDKEWFIGNEESKEWNEHVLAEKQHLFSIGYDQEKNMYTARVLSLQDEVMHLGLLNRSTLEGVWSNLSMELQYLTNDDEERYSIQAHTRLFRNLITQAAEVPLGYHVFSSSLVTIPCQ